MRVNKYGEIDLDNLFDEVVYDILQAVTKPLPEAIGNAAFAVGIVATDLATGLIRKVF